MIDKEYQKKIDECKKILGPIPYDILLIMDRCSKLDHVIFLSILFDFIDATIKARSYSLLRAYLINCSFQKALLRREKNA